MSSDDAEAAGIYFVAHNKGMSSGKRYYCCTSPAGSSTACAACRPCRGFCDHCDPPAGFDEAASTEQGEGTSVADVEWCKCVSHGHNRYFVKRGMIAVCQVCEKRLHTVELLPSTKK